MGGAHHPLSPVLKVGIRHQRKERKKQTNKQKKEREKESVRRMPLEDTILVATVYTLRAPACCP